MKNGQQTSNTKQLIRHITEQLQNLQKFNLGYLHLDRKSKTLSGGELQRVLLSSQLKGSLTGLSYILDEPCSGMHPSDIKNIVRNIEALVEKGNTVITIEHQKELIQSADNVIELGPQAGQKGGEISFMGYPTNYLARLSSEHQMYRPTFPSISHPSKIEIQAAQIHNIKQLNCHFYQEAFNVVTGVSGSGKTSLMRDVLLKSKKQAVNCKSISGLEPFSEIVWVDRNGLDASAISSISTYLGLLDDIKRLFTPLLKGTTIKATQLSYNSKAGQCPECKGLGFVKTKMDFLNDVRTLCESCKGKRYKAEVLSVKLRNKTISEILELTIDEALLFFRKDTKIKLKLELLAKLGLTYLKLGQSSTEFSGGEAQRLKIARILIEKDNSRKLFIFDEASRGLHSSDLRFVLQMFEELISKGHTVIAIEHHSQIISRAQHIVDLHNGKLAFQGSVSELKKQKSNRTGKYL